jgi:hypothetical protein
MGDHYVPRKLLSYFQVPDEPGIIWMYDKQAREPKRAAISRVAQERDFYDDNVEEELARSEGHANPILDKLRERQPINSEERAAIAHYVGTMMKRVPFRRAKVTQGVPQALAEVVHDLKRQLLELGTIQAISAEVLAHRLAEVDAAALRYTDCLPPEIIAQLREPWPSSGMLDAIFTMSWRVAETSGPQFFMTSDNPAFLFTAYGLARPESELVFPLSTTRALHGFRAAGAKALFSEAVPQWMVREFNRRVASTTYRFAFSHTWEPWILPVLRKNAPYLSRIVDPRS